MVTAVPFDPRYIPINPAFGRVCTENFFLSDGQDMVVGPGTLKLACDDAAIRPHFVAVPKECASSDVCQLRVSSSGDGSRDCVLIVDSHRRLFVLEARGCVSAGSVMIVSFETHRLVQMEKAQRRQFGLGSIVLVANLDEQQRRVSPFLALVAAPVCVVATAEQREMWHCAMTHMHNSLFRYLRFCFSAAEFRPPNFEKITPKIRALGLLPGDGDAVRRFTLSAMQPKAAMIASQKRRMEDEQARRAGKEVAAARKPQPREANMKAGGGSAAAVVAAAPKKDDEAASDGCEAGCEGVSKKARVVVSTAL